MKVTTFSRCLLIQIGAFVMREGGDRATVKRTSHLLKGCQFLMATTIAHLSLCTKGSRTEVYTIDGCYDK